MQNAPLFAAAFVFLASIITQEADAALTTLSDTLKAKLEKWAKEIPASINTYALARYARTTFHASANMQSHGFVEVGGFYSISMVNDESKDKLQFTAEYKTSSWAGDADKRKSIYPDVLADAASLKIVGKVHVGGKTEDSLETQVTLDDIASIKAGSTEIPKDMDDKKFKKLVGDTVHELGKDWQTKLIPNLKNVHVCM